MRQATEGAAPHDTNELGQPVGFAVPDWQPPAVPPRETMEGRYCRLEPLSSAHAAQLYAANALDRDGGMWTYMSHGPFETVESYLAWVDDVSTKADPLFFAIVDKTSGKPLGVASYMRIDPKAGSIEVGSIAYSPLLQRSRAATEAMFLMMQQAFGLGYRRYEWKCNALNAPSRAAAQRLGFSYEGVFRQHMIVKGRNRDTAWYAAIDSEWPALKAAYERWLAPENFDASGKQRIRLSDLTAPILKARG
jgi:RimJ/RimL family protein N-acetyltransferase